MLAAGAYAFVPLTVELTGDANPFWFNMILQLSLIPVVAAGLAVMARSWFLASEMPLWHLLTSTGHVSGRLPPPRRRFR